MFIEYKDASTKFRALLQTALQTPNDVRHILVTRAEMKTLIEHPEAKFFLSEYIEQRQSKLNALEQQELALRNDLEHADTHIDKQRIYNRLSEVEEEVHTLRTSVPASITQSGITIATSMRG